MFGFTVEKNIYNGSAERSKCERPCPCSDCNCPAANCRQDFLPRSKYYKNYDFSKDHLGATQRKSSYGFGGDTLYDRLNSNLASKFLPESQRNYTSPNNNSFTPRDKYVLNPTTNTIRGHEAYNPFRPTASVYSPRPDTTGMETMGSTSNRGRSYAASEGGNYYSSQRPQTAPPGFHFPDNNQHGRDDNELLQTYPDPENRGKGNKATPRYINAPAGPDDEAPAGMMNYPESTSSQSEPITSSTAQSTGNSYAASIGTTPTKPSPSQSGNIRRRDLQDARNLKEIPSGTLKSPYNYDPESDVPYIKRQQGTETQNNPYMDRAVSADSHGAPMEAVGTQSGPLNKDLDTQSDPRSNQDLGTQSGPRLNQELGTQSGRQLNQGLGTQSGPWSNKDLGTQSGRQLNHELGTQSVRSSIHDLGTQPDITWTERGMQGGEIVPRKEKGIQSRSLNTDQGTQPSNHVHMDSSTQPTFSLQDSGTQPEHLSSYDKSMQRLLDLRDICTQQINHNVPSACQTYNNPCFRDGQTFSSIFDTDCNNTYGVQTECPPADPRPPTPPQVNTEIQARVPNKDEYSSIYDPTAPGDLATLLLQNMDSSAQLMNFNKPPGWNHGPCIPLNTPELTGRPSLHEVEEGVPRYSASKIQFDVPVESQTESSEEEPSRNPRLGRSGDSPAVFPDIPQKSPNGHTPQASHGDQTIPETNDSGTGDTTPVVQPTTLQKILNWWNNGCSWPSCCSSSDLHEHCSNCPNIFLWVIGGMALAYIFHHSRCWGYWRYCCRSGSASVPAIIAPPRTIGCPTNRI